MAIFKGFLICCAKAKREVKLSTQMLYCVYHTLVKTKSTPVGVVAEDLNDFTCISHTQQHNCTKNIVKGRGGFKQKNTEPDETSKQTCKIINMILL